GGNDANYFRRHSGSRETAVRNPYALSWLWIPGLRFARPGTTELQLLLPRGPSGLLLSLTVLFVGAVPAIGAAGDGADDAVMSGIVTGDAANHGAFQATLGISGRSGNDRQRCGGENGGCGFHDAASPKEFASSTVRALRSSMSPHSQSSSPGLPPPLKLRRAK